MKEAGVDLRGGEGFPWNYGPGEPALPAVTRHGYTPPLPVLYNQASSSQFRVILNGNPANSPRPRGPWVTGPDLVAFPIPAITGGRMKGGVGTDLTDQSTWQRQYIFDNADHVPQQYPSATGTSGAAWRAARNPSRKANP